MLDSSAIKTSSFFPPKNARGRSDRDYYCNQYTYVKAFNFSIYIHDISVFCALCCFL